ncbi:MAG: hypothetical protein ACO1OK_10330 [Devosia sp.]
MDSRPSGGFDAATMERRMHLIEDEDPPSLATQFVALAGANHVLETLACNLAAYLAQAQVERSELRGSAQRHESGDESVRRLLANALDLAGTGDNLTDIPATDYDADAARRIELDMIADSFERLRRVALHEF